MKLRAMYVDGKVVLVMTARELLTMEHTLITGVEKLESTARFMAAMPRRKRDSSAGTTAKRARRAVDSLRVATKGMFKEAASG